MSDINSADNARIEKAGRKERNAFHYTESVIVQRPATDVFEFLARDLPARYAVFASGQESVEVTETGEVIEGSAQDLREASGGQELAGRVEIQKVPNSLLYTSFCPRTGDFGARFIRKMSVYYDLEKIGSSETVLRVTSVIQMANLWTKLFAMIIGIGKLLGNQMTGELSALKSEIEAGDKGAGERLNA